MTLPGVASVCLPPCPLMGLFASSISGRSHAHPPELLLQLSLGDSPRCISAPAVAQLLSCSHLFICSCLTILQEQLCCLKSQYALQIALGVPAGDVDHILCMRLNVVQPMQALSQQDMYERRLVYLSLQRMLPAGAVSAARA